MPSGGARTRSGPAPDPQALRRDRDGKDWVKLPAAGRQGETPEWPLEVPDPTVAELTMWSRLWKKPQAVVWEADGVHDQVAMYVRTFIESSVADGTVARRTLLRQMADALLLTIPALHAARYTIANTPATAPKQGPKHPAGRSSRALLTVVEPDADKD